MTSDRSEASPAVIRALLFGGPAFYFLVTVGVGVWLFPDDLALLGATVGVALVGTVVGFALLRRSYRRAGYL